VNLPLDPLLFIIDSLASVTLFVFVLLRQGANELTPTSRVRDGSNYKVFLVFVSFPGYGQGGLLFGQVRVVPSILFFPYFLTHTLARPLLYQTRH